MVPMHDGLPINIDGDALLVADLLLLQIQVEDLLLTDTYLSVVEGPALLVDL